MPGSDRGDVRYSASRRNDAKKGFAGDAKNARHTMQNVRITRLAGVSTSTVSCVLSGSNPIHEETRERIQILARQFNYTINSVATNLRSGIK